jgi:glycerophosphoryl diester phosphodiesterase
MSLTKFTKDIQYHAKQEDLPNDVGGLSAEAYKAICDQGVVDTQNFINNTLIPEVEVLDAGNLKIAGDQTVAGKKQFNASPVVPDPTLTMHATNKQYVDNTVNTTQLLLSQQISNSVGNLSMTVSDLSDEVDANKADIEGKLTAHKAGTDHDGRYYTEAEFGSTTDGSSGADKVGVTPIATFSGEKVQAVLESVKTRFDAIAVTNVNVEVANTHYASDGKTYTSQSQRFDSIDTQLADNAYSFNILNVIPTKSKLRLIAHRGLKSMCPENTIHAFELAAEYGFWGIETDVKETLDGQYVLFHDDTVDALTDGTGTIESKTLAEVQTLTIDVGKYIARYPNAKIPLFTDYLAICKKYGVVPVIELKGVISNMSNFLSVLKGFGFENTAFVLSFDFTQLQAIRAISKNVPLMYVSTLTAPNIVKCNALGNCHLAPDIAGTTLDLVRLAHKSNVLVNSWTATTLANVTSAKNAEADFISTEIYVW